MHDFSSSVGKVIKIFLKIGIIIENIHKFALSL